MTLLWYSAKTQNVDASNVKFFFPAPKPCHWNSEQWNRHTRSQFVSTIISLSTLTPIINCFNLFIRSFFFTRSIFFFPIGFWCHNQIKLVLRLYLLKKFHLRLQFLNGTIVLVWLKKKKQKSSSHTLNPHSNPWLTLKFISAVSIALAKRIESDKSLFKIQIVWQFWSTIELDEVETDFKRKIANDIEMHMQMWLRAMITANRLDKKCWTRPKCSR